MANNDFSQTEREYKNLKAAFEEMQIPEQNKKLAIEFIDSCTVGMYGEKIGKRRALKILECLKKLCVLLPAGKIWNDVTKAEIKGLLMQINETPTWGEWDRYAKLSVLRKFMTWVRYEYGYPEGYPDREKLLNMLPLMKFAPECKYSIQKPNKLKAVNEIPTAQEIQFMLQACDTYKNKTEGARDKAFISILEEVGTRIGGLGTLCIKNVYFDHLGALLVIHDKTMNGDPVRIIKSAGDLRAWLAVHPAGTNPDAPLWVNLRYSKRIEMDYYSMRTALQKAVKTHNELAKKKGLTQITRRIHFHAFRYYAQTRDMLDGMPVSVQCMQRGWSPMSKQPMRYARVTTQQADEWLAARYGQAEKVEVTNEGPINKEVQSRQPAPKKIDLPGYL